VDVGTQARRAAASEVCVLCRLPLRQCPPMSSTLGAGVARRRPPRAVELQAPPRGAACAAARRLGGGTRESISHAPDAAAAPCRLGVEAASTCHTGQPPRLRADLGRQRAGRRASLSRAGAARCLCPSAAQGLKLVLCSIAAARQSAASVLYKRQLFL
jgi:hypothetical protein